MIPYLIFDFFRERNIMMSTQKQEGGAFFYKLWKQKFNGMVNFNILSQGKVAHFFGLPLCQCCRFILWGFYPIGAGLEHCNCIGSSGRGYQLANAVPIKATGTPIPCHWRIKFQVTNENQSRRLDFQSLPSEGRWSANPAVFQKLCGPISLATRIQLECQ